MKTKGFHTNRFFLILIKIDWECGIYFVKYINFIVISENTMNNLTASS